MRAMLGFEAPELLLRVFYGGSIGKIPRGISVEKATAKAGSG